MGTYLRCPQHEIEGNITAYCVSLPRHETTPDGLRAILADAQADGDRSVARDRDLRGRMAIATTAAAGQVELLTRMIARIEDWKDGRGAARGRAETDRVLGEAHKLFDEVSNMPTEMRQELLGSGRRR